MRSTPCKELAMAGDPRQDDSTFVLHSSGEVQPRQQRWLVLGGGYCGMRLAARLLARGDAVVVTHRTAAGHDGFSHDPRHPHGQRLQAVVFDSRKPQVPNLEPLAPFDAVLSTIPPDANGTDPVQDQLADALLRLAPPWVGYLSTSGVYGNLQGRWADESMATGSRNRRSQARISSEAAWQNSGLAPLIMRLPGIYGPGRSPFRQLRQGNAQLLHKPGQMFSRVHVDDVVGAVLWCHRQGRQGTVVNICDSCPSPRSEALAHAAHLIGARLPPCRAYEDVAPSMGAMARSFWEENRRVSNRRLLAWGYRLLYPGYREGYPATLAEEQARSAFSHRMGDGQQAG